MTEQPTLFDTDPELEEVLERMRDIMRSWPVYCSALSLRKRIVNVKPKEGLL